jgi:uncharacterized protein (DUF2237 family)
MFVIIVGKINEAAMKTVEGFYRDGKIELADLSGETIANSQVLVTFLDPAKIHANDLREYPETLEIIQGIQDGIADVEAGHTRPIEEFREKMYRKYNTAQES